MLKEALFFLEIFKRFEFVSQKLDILPELNNIIDFLWLDWTIKIKMAFLNLCGLFWS